jgi:hypothetical protein
MHEQQVNDRYQPASTVCWQVQLDHAIFAALHTSKDTATYWVEEAERLAGKIAIAQAGGTFRSAAKLVPAEQRNYLKGQDLSEPPRDATSLYSRKSEKSDLTSPESVL